MPHSGSVFCRTTVAGDCDPGQRTGIRGECLKCMGRATWVRQLVIQPEKPVQNAFIRSSNEEFEMSVQTSTGFVRYRERRS